MKLVTFLEKGEKLVGQVKSEANNYLQVDVEGKEYIITAKQVIKIKDPNKVIVPIPVKELKLIDIKLLDSVAKKIISESNKIPSMEDLSKSMNCSKEDIRYTLKQHNLEYCFFMNSIWEIIREKGNNVPVDTEIIVEGIKKNILSKQSLTIPEVAKVIKVKAKRLRLQMEDPLAWNNLIATAREEVKENQFLWHGKIVTVSHHAQKRIQDRFNLQPEEVMTFLKESLKKVARLKRWKEDRKRQRRKHGESVVFLVSYAKDVIFVMTEDYSVLKTAFPCSSTEWVANVEEIAWIVNSKSLK